MSIRKIYLDKKTFVEMYKSESIQTIFNADIIIHSDKKSEKYVKLLKKGRKKKLKKIMDKKD
jgi:hypothetical protein